MKTYKPADYGTVSPYLIVSDAHATIDAASPDWPAVPGHAHVYVPDVDETYRKALAAGAMSVQAPVGA